MQTKQPATPAPTKNINPDQADLNHAIRGYVESHRRLHGQKRTAGSLGVSRHTLWRYLERGHAGRAVPAAVLDSVGQSTQEIGAATLEIIIDLEGLRPDPALRPLRRKLEDALLLLCAAPLTTVDELARFGRVPASTLRERLEKLTKRGLVDTVSHHLGALGSRPQRRYFPTDKGVTAAGAATEGREHMLMTYPLSRQWFRLLAERLDAVAVLYRVAAMIADADPKRGDMRVDHHRHGPYDLLVTLSGGLTIGVIRQGPMLPTSNLRYRLRSIEHLPSSERPFLTLVVSHADQATRRAIRALGDPSERRRTFVATEGELLAGDHTGVVWQQCGYGLGQNPPVEISPETSLAAILPWADDLLESAHGSRRDDPRPDADNLYSTNVQATMPEPARQLASCLANQLTKAEKDVLDLLAAWPWCSREQLAGLMGGVTLRRVNQALRLLRERDLVQEDDSRLVLTDRGLTCLGRRGPRPGPLDLPARRLQPQGIRRHRPARPGLPAAPPRRRGQLRRRPDRRGVPFRGPRPVRPAAHPPLQHRLPPEPDQLHDPPRRIVHPGVQRQVASLPAGVRAPGHHAQAHPPAPGVLPTLLRLRLGGAGPRGPHARGAVRVRDPGERDRLPGRGRRYRGSGRDHRQCGGPGGARHPGRGVDTAAAALAGPGAPGRIVLIPKVQLFCAGPFL